MKNRYSLTEVQLRVMYGLALKTGHRARVGRGHQFKCNRITARALQELGLVETDAGYATGKEPPVFAIELTADGRELMMHPDRFLARTSCAAHTRHTRREGAEAMRARCAEVCMDHDAHSVTGVAALCADEIRALPLPGDDGGES